VTPIGPLPQIHGRASPKFLVVSSGPVILDIRPLSDYQRTLIDAVLSLRSRGWSDRHIAKHFNDAGYLTPGGHRWFHQSVYSLRKKYEARLVRLGG
jgi:hypothetical protein